MDFNSLWLIVFGAVSASVAWWLVLNNTKKKLADFLQAPTKFFDGVMDELGHMEDDVRAKVLAVLNKVNQTIGK